MKAYKITQLIMKDKIHEDIYIWDNVKNPIGVMQLIHGSCENITHYETFIKFLNKNNIIVVSHNIRGHGEKAFKNNSLGFFKKENGWNQLIADEKSINDYIHLTFPNLSYYIFGHSMGSFIVRDYLSQYGNTVNKAILSGTGNFNIILIKIINIISNHRAKINPLTKEDHLLYNLSYKNLNKKFKTENNELSFLSRDPKVWSEYLNDPTVFKYFTSTGYRDLFYGILQISKKKTFQKTKKDLPILFISGKNDPVGQYGKGVQKVIKKYQKYNCTCEIKLYDNLRHKPLKEPEYETVQNDILYFLKNN